MCECSVCVCVWVYVCECMCVNVVCVCVCVCVCECMCVSAWLNISASECMSENVKITHAETMSQNFRHIVISTHKSVEMCRAETMCTFSLRKKFVKKCDIRTYIQTYRQTYRQTIPLRRCFSHQKHAGMVTKPSSKSKFGSFWLHGACLQISVKRVLYKFIYKHRNIFAQTQILLQKSRIIWKMILPYITKRCLRTLFRSGSQLLYLVTLKFLKYVSKELMGFESTLYENALCQVSGLETSGFT